MDTAIQRWNRLYMLVNGLPTIGVGGIRDTDHPCDAFMLGKPHGDCSTDGHYMCDECTERASCDGCGKRPMSCECNPCSWCSGEGFVGVTPCRECKSTGKAPP